MYIHSLSFKLIFQSLDYSNALFTPQKLSRFLLYVLGLKAFSKFSGEGTYQNTKTSILPICLKLVIVTEPFVACLFRQNLAWQSQQTLTLLFPQDTCICIHVLCSSDHFTSQHSYASLPMGAIHPAGKKRNGSFSINVG